MTTFRPGLFSWGLLVVIAGAMAVYSVTVGPFTPFQVVVAGLAAIGVVLAVAALIPRKEEPDAVPGESEASELLDVGVSEQEPLDAGGTEVDLGDR